MDFFTDDSELTCAPPFRALGPYRGRNQIARFVARHLTKEVTIDLTRKQVARDTVTWTVRFDQGQGTRVDGPAQAGFAGNTVSTLRLGAPAPG
jgi:NTE family protein